MASSTAMLTPLGYPQQATLYISMPAGSSEPSETLFLGRGGVTGIRDPRMSRRIAKVFWMWIELSKPTLMIEGITGQGTVQVNSQRLKPAPIPLMDQDVVSLISPDMSNTYNYRVFLPNKSRDESQQTLACSADLSGIKRDSPPNVDVAEEFSCAICLDIMVNPVMAVPCGHAFCGTCLVPGGTECPSCRTTLKGKPMPSRPLGHAISLLVEKTPEVFSQDDVQQYLSRTTSKTPLQPRGKRPRLANMPAVAGNTPPTVGLSSENAIVID